MCESREYQAYVYIDESGNSSLKNFNDNSHRYFVLGGVIIFSETHKDNIANKILEICKEHNNNEINHMSDSKTELESKERLSELFLEKDKNRQIIKSFCVISDKETLTDEDKKNLQPRTSRKSRRLTPFYHKNLTFIYERLYEIKNNYIKKGDVKWNIFIEHSDFFDLNAFKYYLKTIKDNKKSIKNLQDSIREISPNSEISVIKKNIITENSDYNICLADACTYSINRLLNGNDIKKKMYINILESLYLPDGKLNIGTPKPNKHKEDYKGLIQQISKKLDDAKKSTS